MSINKFGLALQGFGAGVQGRGPEFLRGLELQRQSLSEERKQALIEDAFTVHGNLSRGEVGKARNLLVNRLEAIRQLGGDPSDTAELLQKIDSGDVPGAIADVGTVLEFAQATGRLNLPKSAEPIREIIDGQVVTVDPSGKGVAQAIEGFTRQAEPPKTQIVDGQLVTIDPSTGQATAQPVQGLRPDVGRSIDRSLRARQIAVMEAAERRMGQKLSAGLEKVLFTSQEATIQAQRDSNEFSILADQYAEAASIRGGVRGSVAETLKGLLGTEDDVSELKRRFNKVRISEAIRNLPPGAASEKEMDIAMKPLPKENANPEQVVQFLRGMAKMSRFEAGYNQYKSDFISKRSTGKGINQGWRRKLNAPALNREVAIAEIYETAQNRNLTPEEVIRQLGIEGDLF